MKMFGAVLVLFLFVCATARTKCMNQNVEDHTCPSTEYQSYVTCIQTRFKRSMDCASVNDNEVTSSDCNENKCESCNCNSCTSSKCGQFCSHSCCNSCCKFAACTTHECCMGSCHSNCENSSCRRSCRHSCKEFVNTNTSSDVQNRNQQTHNISTVIHLNNVINNTNLIDIPMNLDSSNINNITIDDKTSTNKSELTTCCDIVKPMYCTPISTPPYVHCVFYRKKQCGAECLPPPVPQPLPVPQPFPVPQLLPAPQPLPVPEPFPVPQLLPAPQQLPIYLPRFIQQTPPWTPTNCGFGGCSSPCSNGCNQNLQFPMPSFAPQGCSINNPFTPHYPPYAYFSTATDGTTEDKTATNAFRNGNSNPDPQTLVQFPPTYSQVPNNNMPMIQMQYVQGHVPYQNSAPSVYPYFPPIAYPPVVYPNYNFNSMYPISSSGNINPDINPNISYEVYAKNVTEDADAQISIQEAASAENTTRSFPLI